MRKILTLFVAALFATSMMYADPIGGSCGDGTGLEWSLEDGTLTITYDGEGSGEISFDDDMYYDGLIPWYDHVSEITSISLPEGLKVIGDNAFVECAISSITIPNSVTTIDYWSFYGCVSLETIVWGSSLEILGEAAFNDCEALTSVIIPDGVTTIGEVAFANCINLTTVTIPESVTFIGESAFAGCTEVTDVYCYPHPENLTWETDNLNAPDFKADKATICHVHEDDHYDYAHFLGHVNVTYRSDLDADPTICGGGLHWAYADGVLTITYDNTYEGEHDGAIISVTPMPWDAYLSEITSISLPEGLKRIGVRVFEGCSAVEEVTIPSSVSNIEYYAFKSCSSLKSVIALPTTAPTLGADVFDGCHADLTITYPCGSTESYESKWSAYSANLESTCETPTGIEEISNSQSSNRKFLQDGHLFIEKNGKFYNATGAEVK